jgi:prepilin-type N-terminal cleavage/methylation domain-containing protein/prepilin-type processing-associated H-X9-DG protein
MLSGNRARGQGVRFHSETAGARGFTLVELLVVIGIIAVLISILLPVLTRMQEQGRRTKCLSNLRALGQGIAMYAHEYRDRLPNSNARMTTKDYAAASYVLVALNRDYVRSPGVFHCPSDSDARPDSIETADYTLSNSARVSYDFYSVFWTPEQGRPKLCKIKGAPLAWDLAGGTLPGGDLRLRSHSDQGGNVVFADGHAEWQQQSDWDGPNWPSPATKYYRW